MRSLIPVQMLRIFVGESHKHAGIPVYEKILLKAREMQLTGATVFRGIAGYGSSKIIHTSKLLDIRENLPLIVEIIDTPEKIAAFLHFVEEITPDSLITIENISARIPDKKPA
ncbi:MAG: DUF190 domain-containing protein [Spirochaetia bacterium]|nr:DUF190 domain-containing protein [Spirochaetia bacterium]